MIYVFSTLPHVCMYFFSIPLILKVTPDDIQNVICLLFEKYVISMIMKVKWCIYVNRKGLKFPNDERTCVRSRWNEKCSSISSRTKLHRSFCCSSWNDSHLRTSSEVFLLDNFEMTLFFVFVDEWMFTVRSLLDFFTFQ